jgi:hypothetical protein
MSTIRVQNIQHTGNSTNAIALASDGTCSARLTDNGGLQFANRNKIINGEFRVNQRNHSGSAGHNAYTLDRWRYARSANTEFSQDQSTVTPDGFANSVKMTSIGSNGSTGTGDYAYWRYFIEGQDLQELNKGTSAATAFTLSFYFKSDTTGTFAISVLDQNSRMCNANYTVSNTNWNRYTITIPADTTGTIANSNAAGLEIKFWLIAGSNYTSGSAVHTWGSYSAASEATGFNAHITTNGVNLYLTGVQLEISDYATPFEHRSFAQELALCQRYFQTVSEKGDQHTMGIGMNQSGSLAHLVIPLHCTMRTTPSLDQLTGTNYYTLYSNGGQETFDSWDLDTSVISPQRVEIKKSSLSITQGSGNLCRYNNDNAEIRFSAEL